MTFLSHGGKLTLRTEFVFIIEGTESEGERGSVDIVFESYDGTAQSLDFLTQKATAAAGSNVRQCLPLALARQA